VESIVSRRFAASGISKPIIIRLGAIQVERLDRRDYFGRNLEQMAYWLFKSEPTAYSFDDLLAAPDQTTGWDGVRNFQARNFLRDSITVGDGVLFYHSGADPPCVAGIAEVVKPGHPDPTAFDPKDPHFDPKSDRSDPTWFQVSIKAVRPVAPPLSLPFLNTIPALSGMELLRKGSRLSVQRVTEKEWKTILSLARLKKR
jgi:predicted RNA-binding protein with PUA-like domain